MKYCPLPITYYANYIRINVYTHAADLETKFDLSTLVGLGFKRSTFDPCVYFRRNAQGLLILAVVVDDILAASTSQALVDQFDREMRAVYDLTSFEQPKRIVGLNIQTTPHGLTIDQVQFAKDMTIPFKQQDCKPVSTPVALGDVPHGASPLLPSNNHYLSLVGSLLWASLTRPDIAMAVSLACSRSVNPTKADLAAVIRILRYLLHTPHVKLTFSKSYTGKYVTQVFADAAWANAPKAKSRYGYLVSNLFVWLSYHVGDETHHHGLLEHC